MEGVCLSPEPEAALILEAPFGPLEERERKPALRTLPGLRGRLLWERPLSGSGAVRPLPFPGW